MSEQPNGLIVMRSRDAALLSEQYWQHPFLYCRSSGWPSSLYLYRQQPPICAPRLELPG